MKITSNTAIDFSFQLDEFYLDLQQDGSKIALLSQEQIINRPFPGLRPFKTSEFQLFKGRSGQAEELIKRLKKNHFLAVIGSSGTGKSSLIRAGLIPQLFGGYLHEAGNRWNIAVCRPGKDPVENLSIALASVKSHSKEKDKILNEFATISPLLNNSIYGILEVKELLDQVEPPSNLLIIIDQFEELFRFDRKDLQKDSIENHFVNLLLKASLNPGSSVYVITTMRSEFLGSCVKYRGLPEAINEGQYLVPQLTRNQLKEVIEGPINLTGKKIVPGLVELLVNEIEETKLKENLDQLPILQHALMRTYEAAVKDGCETEIGYEYYREVGEMKMSLANHAEAKFKELNNNESSDKQLSKRQQITKIVFQALTDLSADEKGGRRPTTLKNIYAIAERLNATEKEVDDVVNHFRKEDTSFIMPPENTKLYPNLILDISHESLMRNWERLNKWILEEVRNARLYKILNERREQNESDNDQWVKGILLKELLGWQKDISKNAVWASRYVVDYDNQTFEKNIKFLNRSKQISDLEINAKERRKRTLITILSVAVTLSTLLAIWGFTESRRARNGEEEAKKQTLFADSSAQIANQQKSLAEKSAFEAESLKIVAEKSALLAQNQEQKAKNSEKEAKKQKELAIQNLIIAKNMAAVADSQKVIAIKSNKELQLQLGINEACRRENFYFDLTNRNWWDNKLDASTKSQIRDTLFQYYNAKNHQDSLHALSFENSMKLLKEAEEGKNDFGNYLYYIKQAKETDNNFVTKKLLDSLVNITIPFKRKYSLPYSYSSYSSYKYPTVLKFVPNSGNKFLVGNYKKFYISNVNDDSLKTIHEVDNASIAVGISNDCSKLLSYNKEKKYYTVYDRNNKQLETVSLKIKEKKSEFSKSNDELDDNYNFNTCFSPDNHFLALQFSKFDFAIYNFVTKKIDTFLVEGKINNINFNNSSNKLLVCLDESVIIMSPNSFEKKIINLKNFIDGNTSDNLLKGEFSKNDSLIWLFTTSKKIEVYHNNEKGATKIKIPFKNIFTSPSYNYSLTYEKYYYYEKLQPISILDSNLSFKKVFPWHKEELKNINFSNENMSIASADNNTIYIWQKDDSLNMENIDLYFDKKEIALNYSDTGWEYYDKKKFSSAMYYYKKAAALDTSNKGYLNFVGNIYKNIKKYDSAIAIFNQSIAIDSLNAATWNYMGLVYYDQKEYHLAIYYFRQALALDTAYIVYRKNIGDAYRKAKKYDSAIAIFKQSIAIDSLNADTWNYLGNVYWDQKDYYLATYHYRHAVALDTTNIDYRNNLGESYRQAKNYDSAIVTFKQSIAIDSINAATRNYLGNVYWDHKDYYLATYHYRHAVALDTTDIDYRNNLGGSYRQTKNYDSAIAIYKQSLTIDSLNAATWNYLGNLYWDQKDYYLATFYYRHAVALDTTDIVYRNNLGESYRNTKIYDSAIVTFKQSIAIDSLNADTWNNLGLIYYDQKKYDSAIYYFKQSIVIDSTNIDAWNNLASVYSNQNQHKMAIQIYDEALMVNKSSLLYNGLSYEFNRLKMFDSALKFADKAISMDTIFANPHAHKGYAFLKKNNFDSAYLCFESAKVLNSDYAKSYFYLACYFAVKSKLQEAITNLQRAVEKGFDDIGWMEEEECLNSLRTKKEYLDIIDKLKFFHLNDKK